MKRIITVPDGILVRLTGPASMFDFSLMKYECTRTGIDDIVIRNTPDIAIIITPDMTSALLFIYVATSKSYLRITFYFTI